MTTPDLAPLVAELTREEKASLTAGADMWNIPGVERLGIPAIRVTDGPNGARGSSLLGAGTVTAVCVPCGSALGATWDPDLIEEVGAVIGQEARTKSCRFLLAPTINLHRSPVAGRNFECYAEDPLLSGKVAAAFIRGVQSEGVAATPKHLVANEAEFERASMSSDVDERALRELYLRPFELAVREGGALAVMTSYNRLNGRFCTEDEQLLTTILRDEWGFEGIVMTDWFGIADTVVSSAAGLDLEMPGPARAYGEALLAAVEDGRVPAARLDAIVARWLRVVDRLGAWHDGPATEASIDRPEHRAVARRAASDSCVLLANDGVLPLVDDGTIRVALIGPRAARVHMMGGGSAQLLPHHRTSVLDVLRDRLGDRLAFEPGGVIDRSTPEIAGSLLTTPSGEPGVLVELWNGRATDGEPDAHLVVGDTRIILSDTPAPGIGHEYSFRATATFTPATSGPHVLTFVEMGPTRLHVDGDLVLDEEEGLARGGELLGMGSIEREVPIDLVAGRPVELVVTYHARAATFLALAKIGVRPVGGGDPIEQAAAAAAAADVAVVLVGTSEEWESEGHDRASMDLPGDQDELVRRVAAANPRTIVLVNAGSPVTMPWVDGVAAAVQVWLGGQEMAPAIDAVLFGDAEPAGRLPTTIPLRLEHNPTYGSFPGENDHHRYGEGLLVGYRWYDTRHLPVRFPFGHGGSYTTFEWGEAAVSSPTLPGGGTVTVEVPVTNTGSRRGAEVVQCYVAPPAGGPHRPDRELAGFAKLWLDPGETATASIELDERAFAHWDPTGDAGLGERLAGSFMNTRGEPRHPEPGWWIDAGTYRVEVGASVADLRRSLEVTAAERRIGP
jgi:beta-glucosidase